jgi:hypothetical protein
VLVLTRQIILVAESGKIILVMKIEQKQVEVK